MVNTQQSGSAAVTSQLIKSSKTSPAYLHSNSTSHEWVFGAFAELIDNAYDPDVAASQIFIDIQYWNDDEPYLTFSDNGSGMDENQLHKMLSFGYSDKSAVGAHQPIGRYGNGFKSGSMRLGRDAIVLTRNRRTMSCGLLSQSYLQRIKADTVLVPIVTWDTNTKVMVNTEHGEQSLNDILKYSLFDSMVELMAEFENMELHPYSNSGTKICVYNLRKNPATGKQELDLDNDPSDIRFLEHVEYGIEQRQVEDHEPEYRKSLRQYCSILYLKPRMQIYIRKMKVKTKPVGRCLSRTEVDSYRPKFVDGPVKITFGFTNIKTEYGMLLYHRNRLIEAYVRVGLQKQPNSFGVGVIGVMEANFLEVSHNKQSFSRDSHYQSTMSSLGQKLNDYWKEKKNDGLIGDEVQSIDVEDDNRTAPDWTWVQCDNPQCLKWRRLPESYIAEALPDKWFCYMNPDPERNSCSFEEEPEDSDISAPYEKIYKRYNEKSKRVKSRDKDRQLRDTEEELRRKEQEVTQLKEEVEVTELTVQQRLEEQREELLQKIRQQDGMLLDQRTQLDRLKSIHVSAAGGGSGSSRSHPTPPPLPPAGELNRRRRPDAAATSSTSAAVGSKRPRVVLTDTDYVITTAAGPGGHASEDNASGMEDDDEEDDDFASALSHSEQQQFGGGFQLNLGGSRSSGGGRGGGRSSGVVAGKKISRIETSDDSPRNTHPTLASRHSAPGGQRLSGTPRHTTTGGPVLSGTPRHTTTGGPVLSGTPRHTATAGHGGSMLSGTPRHTATAGHGGSMLSGTPRHAATAGPVLSGRTPGGHGGAPPATVTSAVSRGGRAGAPPREPVPVLNAGGFGRVGTVPAAGGAGGETQVVAVKELVALRAEAAQAGRAEQLGAELERTRQQLTSLRQSVATLIHCVLPKVDVSATERIDDIVRDVVSSWPTYTAHD